MNQKLMQRYGDYSLIPNYWLFSSPVCCDSQICDKMQERA